jgi:hypothetical protein
MRAIDNKFAIIYYCVRRPEVRAHKQAAFQLTWRTQDVPELTGDCSWLLRLQHLMQTPTRLL